MATRASKEGSNQENIEKPKKERRPNRKTKTGCLTCRIRKVKCDEDKPTCQTCYKFGVQCNGYVQPVKAKSVSMRHEPPSILPNTEDNRQLAAHRKSLPKRMIPPATPRLKKIAQLNDFIQERYNSMLCRQPSKTICSNEHESQYFSYYKQNMAPNLAHIFAPTLWSYLILQACEQKRSVYHVVVALAALDKSVRKSRSYRRPISIKRTSEDLDYVFSLQHYNTALQAMRRDLSHGTYDLRTALISSLLIIMFEAYLGNDDMALTHIGSCLQLIKHWEDKQSTFCNRSAHLRSMGLPISTASHVEVEVLQAFDEYEAEAMLFRDVLPLEQHLSRKDVRSNLVENIPKTITNLRELRVLSKVVHLRALHFLSAVWSYGGISSRPDVSMNLFDRIKGDPTPQAVAERDKYMCEVLHVHSTYTSLRQRSHKSMNREERVLVAGLSIHREVLTIALMNCFSKDELSWDQYTVRFKVAIENTKLLLEEPQTDTYFTPSTQILQELELIAQKCRDPFIRREALGFLRMKERRELFRDTKTLADVSEWIIEIEEEGMVDGFIPEEARARAVTVYLDQERMSTHVRCQLPKICGLPGEMITRETYLKW